MAAENLRRILLVMGKLDHVIEELKKLPELEQDLWAEAISSGLAVDQHWDELLARPGSIELLERMGDEALAEHDAGKTLPLDDIEWDRVISEAEDREKAAKPPK